VKRRLLLAGAAAPLLGACISVDVGLGNEATPQRQFVLQDAGLATQRRLARKVSALLVQGLPSSAAAETLSMAYAPGPDELAYYQFATWADRPVKRIPQLLVQRLEAAGLADAAGELGGPLPSDWLLTLRIEHLAHEVAVRPGTGRVQFMAELYNRRQPGRVARQRFDASAPAASADSAAAAAAISTALGQTFDALLPWLEAALPNTG
jgi:ABC-type uncharacterized transport system auxiliary subunit